MRAMQIYSPCIAWKVVQCVYAPKMTMEKRRTTREFEGVRMKQDEDPAKYFTRMNKALQKLTMLDGSKDEDEVNVHMMQNMSPAYLVEEILRSAYLTEKMGNIGMGRKEEKGR